MTKSKAYEKRLEELILPVLSEFGFELCDTEFVKVMYRTFLDREAEPAGLQYWLNKLASGMTRENVAAGFAASDEFGAIMARYGF